MAFDGGLTAKAIQKLVGHSSLAVTEKYYRNSQQDVDAAGRIRQAMGLERRKEPTLPAVLPA
jgi:integrase